MSQDVSKYINTHEPDVHMASDVHVHRENLYSYRIVYGPVTFRATVPLHFQQGTVSGGEGHNGLTEEALLAVLIDRLQGLQGVLSCRENALAITKLEEALMWLHHRTRDRISRGVEGTHQP